jgi:RNA polymerase sigma factor for flagellar operon FliA
VEEMEGVWRRYSEEPTPELRARLIEAYAPLARYVVDRLNLRSSSALDYEDLLSEAVVGLVSAVDRFDPGRGVKFETYAYYRIRGAVMDMLRRLDWLPRSVRQRESETAAAYEKLQGYLGRAPSDEELAEEMRIEVEQLDELAQEVALQAVQSLEELVGSAEWDGERDTLGETVADPGATSPETELERHAEQEVLAQAVDALPQAERTVVSLYYYEGLTLKEIGRVLGVTESRTCQIHGKAMFRLRTEVQALMREPAAPSA